MQIEKVPGINWQGRKIIAAMILQDGPLTAESVVVAPTLYLLHLAKSAPLNTLMATGSDLKRLFEALKIAGRQWDEISDDQMSGYIESTLLTQYKLSRETIARHCSSINGMYKHLSKSGFTDKYFEYSFRYLDDDGLEGNGLSPTYNNIRLKKKYINDQLFEVLLEHACEAPGFLRDRNELILELGHKLGLRSFEVTHAKNLKISTIKEIIYLAKKNKRLSCSLTIFGKRKKYRDIDVPTELLFRLERFIKDHEAEIVGDNIICAKDGSALRDSFASRLFKRVKDTALPKLKDKLKQLLEQDDAPYTINWKSVQSLTFHCLRHTYSTNLVTYCNEQGIDPFVYLPDQLGHTKFSTSKQYTNFQAAIYNRDKGRSRFSIEENIDVH
jgi:site-specific recombinase XerD